MRKPLLVVACLVVMVAIASCKKEPLGVHFQMKVNGKLTKISACGTSTNTADILKDTAIFISPSCGGLYPGFYLREVHDGSYRLDERNQMFYWIGQSGGSCIRYATNGTHTGTLTLTSVVHDNQPHYAGKFSCSVIDTARNEEAAIEEGTFLLKKMRY